MRYFFSTGEASGEVAATTLAEEIRKIDAAPAFEGIGAERMREHGFALWRDHTGWASMGPLAAMPRIPKLLLIMFLTAGHLARTKPDLVVLVDFGAFNLRLARRLRAIGYRRPILYFFPPAAWLDRERTAREVSAAAAPLVAFAHQRDFYHALGLPAAYFGHPLASLYDMRPPRVPPAHDGGTVAILPGSRGTELRRHMPALFEAYKALKMIRPHLRGVVGAVDIRAERALRARAMRHGLTELEFVRGTRAAIAPADAAWVASGTAVLECALSGVPAIALYIIARSIEEHARRVYSGRFITIPNLVLQREVVPELLQQAANPAALARAMQTLLNDPQAQYAQFHELREALGPPDALARCAAFAVALAKGA